MKGETDITSYRRVLKEGGYLNPKFPGGTIQQLIHLKEEGFEIVKGKAKDQFFVKDYAKKLAILL